MKLINKVSSKVDNVQKYIFENRDGFIIEFSYIDNNTGKDIICIPTHTMCNIGCKFCHTSDYVGKILSWKIEYDELCDGIEYIVDDLKLNKLTLLISVMGCGDTMLNFDNIITMMRSISIKYSNKNVRFAVATCLPKSCWNNFFSFTQMVEYNKLNVKVHLSLHYTTDEKRKEWMPNSLDIIPSLTAMDFYKKITGNKVEIHYALIEGINDTIDDIVRLGDLLKGRNFNVKFLHYNEKNTIEAKASNKKKYVEFDGHLCGVCGVETEYYVPPGISIGSSCGMFLMEQYIQNKINVPTGKLL